jgi:hypothetical protein
MAWSNVALLATLGFVLALATVRSVARRRLLVVLLLDLPFLVVTLRWAGFRHAWGEWAAAVAAAAVAFGVWWLVFGRRLTPPRDDNIRVWTKDDPI